MSDENERLPTLVKFDLENSKEGDCFHLRHKGRVVGEFQCIKDSKSPSGKLIWVPTYLGPHLYSK